MLCCVLLWLIRWSRSKMLLYTGSVVTIGLWMSGCLLTGKPSRILGIIPKPPQWTRLFIPSGYRKFGIVWMGLSQCAFTYIWWQAVCDRIWQVTPRHTALRFNQSINQSWTSCFLCRWRACLERSSCRRHFSTFSVHFPKTFKTTYLFTFVSWPSLLI